MAKDRLHQEVAAEVGIILKSRQQQLRDQQESEVGKSAADVGPNDGDQGNDDEPEGAQASEPDLDREDKRKALRPPASPSSSMVVGDDEVQVLEADTPSCQPQILAFNEDIVCQHGNLDPDVAAKARLVSDKVWDKFLHYFPDAVPYTSASPLCTLCQVGEGLGGHFRFKRTKTVLAPCSRIKPRRSPFFTWSAGRPPTPRNPSSATS